MSKSYLVFAGDSYYWDCRKVFQADDDEAAKTHFAAYMQSAEKAAAIRFAEYEKNCGGEALWDRSTCGFDWNVLLAVEDDHLREVADQDARLYRDVKAEQKTS